MNRINLDSISGILNFVTCSENFISKYDLIIGTNLYFYEEMDIALKYGLILMNEDGDKSVNVPLSLKSYLTLKTPSDIQIMDIQTIHSLVNIISNKCGISIVAGFIKDVHGDYFESYIVLEYNGEFMCVNIPVSDLFTMKITSVFPVFINNEIIEKRKVKYEEFIEHIDVGMWRVY